MKISSRWKLTHDPEGSPTVLLAIGDLIDDEPLWRLGRGVDVRPLAAAAAPFIRPAGNNAYNLDLTVYKTAATDEAARLAVLEALRTTDDLPKAPLRLEIANDEGLIEDYYYQFAHSFVRGLDAQKVVVGAKPRYMRRWSIVATRFSKTTL